ncbi:MAG TPA: ABC transporter substrate-binding protein, partial [Novosphingobium sp.]|nr:ABC transporter substrate-binding protein [Novosphingobium sp.]
RDGTWPDGTRLTGEDAATALRRVLASLRGTPLASDLGPVEDVVARTGRVVELRLSSPNPDLLRVLAQPEFGLLRANGGSGPMAVERQGDAALLRPYAPREVGLPGERRWEERARSLRLSTLPAVGAVTRFREGSVQAVLGGKWDSIMLARDVSMVTGSLQFDSVAGLFGLTFTHADGFLGEPANREAIAMAIDREALAAALRTPGWTPTTRLVTPGMDGDLGTIGERWAELDLAARRAEAARRVTRWRAGRDQAPALRIALPSTPGSGLLFKRLSDDMAAIGITVRQVEEDKPADLRLVDQVARYARAQWFLGQLACGVRPGPCSPAADRLVDRARSTSDERQRAALLAEAEAELTLANVYVPLGPPVRWTLARRGLSGLTPNRWAAHPLIAFAVMPR